MALQLLSKTYSIRVKIFGAFVVMGMLTGGLGAYGLYVLWSAGRIVEQTYDGPLMAVNFARAASLDFVQLDKELLRRNIVSDSDRKEIDKNLDKLTETFLEDLAIAEQRSLAPDERAVIATIHTLFDAWRTLREGDVEFRAGRQIDALAQKIIGRFDVLTELIADHSFVARRKSVWSIAYFEYISAGALMLALLSSAGITFLLSRRIVRPLSAAAAVADRIAGGELDTPIPSGGRDETGILLRSMSVMQGNIRAMMEREAAQRRSAQNRLTDALESSQEGMILVDADGKIVIANSQVETFFPEVAPLMANGTNFATTSALLAAQLIQSGIRPKIHAKQTITAQLTVGEHQLANGRWIRVSRSETHDGGYFLFLTDFTDIKEREEHYRNAKQEAEAANTAKTNFLANMSHELRTPLNAIIGFSELISSQLFGAVGNPKYVEFAGDILRSGRHLLEIINSVLDLARSESKKLTLNPEPVDLHKIVEECGRMMSEQCLRANVHLDVVPPDEPLIAFGEAAKLRQIVLNLMSNAIKFTKSGGRVCVAADLSPSGEYELRVSDTGIGMSAEEIQIALAPFGQVDTSLSRRYEGTGLGLPLTKAFAELHGGRMTIASEPGKGTTVVVTIPRMRPEVNSQPRALPRDPRRASHQDSGRA